MTVRELINHFSFYFDKIVFFDKTNNIQDIAKIYIDNFPKKTVKNETEFLDEYGDYKVINWEVSIDGSFLIRIEIEEE